MARLAQRDEHALRELHRRYAALVLGVASRLVGATTAEDVVQDIFVTLWTKHASFDPSRGPLKPWLMQITRRRALDGLRRVRRQGSHRHEALDQLESGAVSPDESRWVSMLSSREMPPNAESAAIAGQLGDRIEALLKAIPEGSRRAFVLARVEGRSLEEAAHALGVTKSATKLRVYRVARMLRRELAMQAPLDACFSDKSAYTRRT